MSDDVTQERVQARIAAVSMAARVPLDPDSCTRVARAVLPTVKRFAAANVALGFEVEPSSVTAIARAEIGK
jgi:hypothetical protein